MSSALWIRQGDGVSSSSSHPQKRSKEKSKLPTLKNMISKNTILKSNATSFDDSTNFKETHKVDSCNLMSIVDNSWKDVPSIRSYLRQTSRDESVKNVRILYVIGIILWVLLIFAMKLYLTTLLGFIILLIPIVCFIIGFNNAEVVTDEVEDNIFRTNYTGVGFLILIPLLAWMSKGFSGNRRWYMTILMVAIILILLSLLDIWIKEDWIHVVKHATSILQTMSLVLVIYAIHAYYLTSPRDLGGIHD